MTRKLQDFRLAGPLATRCLAGCVLALSLAVAHSAESIPPETGAREAGSRYFHDGKFEQAISAWETAAERFGAAQDERRRAEVLVQLAQAYQALGHLERSQRSLREALTSERLDAATAASAWTLLGSVLNASGMREQARKALDTARTIARELGRDDLASAALHEIGNLHVALDQQKEALQAYEEAARLASGADNRALRARSLLNAARTAIALRDLPVALTRARAAGENVAGLSASHERAFLFSSLGELYMRIHDVSRDAEPLARSFEALQAALADAERIGDQRTAAQTLGYMARLYERENRLDEAALLNRRAIFFAQQIQAAEMLYRLHWQNARILRAQGNDGRAVLEYRRAADNLQLVRQDLIAASAAAGTASRALIAPLYFELADLLLQRTSKSGDKTETQRLLSEARDVVERSKSAELQDLFQDTCVADQQARVTQVGSVGARTAVIYPIILPDRLELLLSFPDGLKQFTVPIGAARLNDEIRSFRVRLEKRTTREYLPLAQRLYDLLMRPLEPELAARNVETIVFVPDGALRTVPMAALHDGRDFLLRRYAIATTPGLTLTDPQPLLARKLDVLLNGLTAQVQGFSALPNVAGELNAIGKLFGGKELRDKEYLLASVEREMSAHPYNVVHIASHGQFLGDPKLSFLLTYDGKLTMDLLEKFIAPNRYREQPIELLTLSACQTAAGDDRAALGLAGVAVKAGARSALASLWYINDVSSAMIVSDFYRNLQDPNASKAKALRDAQLALLKDSRYNHPGYWAAFLLIGNWL